MWNQQNSILNQNQTLNESNVELVAYSEQILDIDHEIAPGIPSQDQVLREQRAYPESYNF